MNESLILLIISTIASCYLTEQEFPSRYIPPSVRPKIKELVNVYENFNDWDRVKQKWWSVESGQSVGKHFQLVQDHHDDFEPPDDFCLNARTPGTNGTHFFYRELDHTLRPYMTRKFTLGYDLKFADTPFNGRNNWETIIHLYPEGLKLGKVEDLVYDGLSIQIDNRYSKVMLLILIKVKDLDISSRALEGSVLDQLVSDRSWHKFEFSIFDNNNYQLKIDGNIFASGNVLELIRNEHDRLTQFSNKSFISRLKDLLYLWVETTIDTIVMFDNIYVTSEMICKRYEQVDFVNPCHQLDATANKGFYHATSSICPLFTISIITYSLFKHLSMLLK